MLGFNIDFTKVSSSLSNNTAISPRDIFTSLPSKDSKFQYPRDVQGQVWEKWFENRDKHTNIIKMNTGSGKTSVGIILLKSCLNEGVGPAVYIVPDKYLVKQVVEEANCLGILVTTDENSPAFLTNQAILVTNIFKLVNGRSVFGVGDEVKIQIGSLVIDDAHTCLATIEDQFTLSIPYDNPAYSELFNAFKTSMETQSIARAKEIEYGDYNSYVRVPFWSWHEGLSNVITILLKHREHEDLKFTWPLIKDHLKLSKCVVSAKKIEISPHCIPIQMIPSIVNAERRIFMTATLVDESILASHFGVTDNSSLYSPITPNIIGDIGDRMIIIPQVVNPELSDVDIKIMCAKISKTHNIVVIVPSAKRADFWADVVDKVVNKENIHSVVQELRKKHVGLVVVVNRYDGIDLPNNACRLLVIDGLPDVRRLVDKVTQNVLSGSKKNNDAIIQKIEQGMGRGVRSSDDYCAVVLLGKSLCGTIFLNGSLDKFSPATKKQIELSQSIMEQIGQSAAPAIDAIESALQYCLTQDTNWVTTSKFQLVGLNYDSAGRIDQHTINRRVAYDKASRNMIQEAAALLRENVTSNDRYFKGFLKEEAAEYINLYDTELAQQLLKSAASDNYKVLKPLEGISYLRIEGTILDQARECSEFFKTEFRNTNDIIITLNSLLEKIIFEEDTARIFEDSIDDLAKYLGFQSQCPENITGKGPDNLWLLGNNKYMVIECKNGVNTENIITKRECGQLGVSCNWFKEKYDHTAEFTPVMIHPSIRIDNTASLDRTTKIIDSECLEKLKIQVKHFVTSLCAHNNFNDISFIRARLIEYRMRAEDIIVNYTKDFRRN